MAIVRKYRGRYVADFRDQNGRRRIEVPEGSFKTNATRARTLGASDHVRRVQAEGAGLQWGDIDWNRRTAEIRRQWRRGPFYEPKTRSSRRTVELPG